MPPERLGEVTVSKYIQTNEARMKLGRGCYCVECDKIIFPPRQVCQEGHELKGRIKHVPKKAVISSSK